MNGPDDHWEETELLKSVFPELEIVVFPRSIPF